METVADIPITNDQLRRNLQLARLMCGDGAVSYDTATLIAWIVRDLPAVPIDILFAVYMIVWTAAHPAAEIAQRAAAVKN